MKKFPEVVSFWVTSRCNNDCKYCFGPEDFKEMNLPELEKLFCFLRKNGTKGVLLGGGEPLLRDDFSRIVELLTEYKLKIFLDTNGDFFFKYEDIISKHVNVLGLPIDFPDSSYRNKKNLGTILRILDYYKKTKKHPLIRMGTVVTKDNYRRLEEVGELLRSYPIDIWKVYQFTPQGSKAIKNKLFLEVSKKEFDKATQNLKNIFSNSFRVVISKRQERSRAYFFIAPNGNVFIPIDNLDICRMMKIGYIYDKDILEKWEKFVLEDRYVKNLKQTF